EKNFETRPCVDTRLLFFKWTCPDRRVHCQWGPFGEWSECDGCTRTQTRSRSIAVYAQFGGNRCGGERSETRPCESTKACPLELGCGNRFRCRSGMCIPQTLMCNGDQDCEEDNEDERTCENKEHFVCQLQRPPPNIELLGVGLDVATGKSRGSVINTKSFGGQCRQIHNSAYRLPGSLLKFTAKVQNDLNDEMFESEWHYRKDIVKRETYSGTSTGFRNYDYHESDERTRKFRLLILKNDIELASFQASSPEYIPLAEEFWKALSKLPTVYNYAAYRAIITRFGTHYFSEGTIGGSLNVFVRLDSDVRTHKVEERLHYRVCEKVKRFILFIPITHESCDGDYKNLDRTPEISNKTSFVHRVTAEGGGDALIAQLQNMAISTPEANWRAYTNWADSLRSFPKVIKSKLRPIWELVKEVHCARVKKLYLKKALQQYLSESHPCHCLPCEKNGIAVMDNNVCKCIPKPGLLICLRVVSSVEVDGSWSCWSAWSVCSGGSKTRIRSCNNPHPRNGGQQCTGKPTEMEECDDEELDYLRGFEPECFDFSLSPKLKCGPPPTLINGYVLDPKDTYLVGDRVQYRCITGFHLSGPSTFECTAARTWSGSPEVLSNCMMPVLSAGVLASPDKSTYEIGDSVMLSCPEGQLLQGENTAICDPSLNFSPDPTLVTCTRGTLSDRQPVNPSVQCKMWEKNIRGQCVCKLPNECGPSLELCASLPMIGHTVLTVCKVHALRCMKKEPALAEDSLCTWPQRSADSGCSKCHPWETCDQQTSSCRCQDSADCPSPGLSVCVRVGSDSAPLTLSECEAGLRRCKGERVTVVDIEPCSN
uniref:Complement component C7 n=1 Tax=Periophthalmus magnuspinnatus TaxID=409849 RepID=A0A3B4ATH6_9GOBI